MLKKKNKQLLIGTNNKGKLKEIRGKTKLYRKNPDNPKNNIEHY